MKNLKKYGIKAIYPQMDSKGAYWFVIPKKGLSDLQRFLLALQVASSNTEVRPNWSVRVGTGEEI